MRVSYQDEQDVELPRGIMDCTNHHMTAGPDYLREVYTLYRTLAEVRMRSPRRELFLTAVWI